MKKGNYFIAFGLFLFFPGLLTTLGGENYMAEIIGNIIYGAFSIGLIFHIIHFFLDQKK